MISEELKAIYIHLLGDGCQYHKCTTQTYYEDVKIEENGDIY